jgi:hypothetical protein
MAKTFMLQNQFSKQLCNVHLCQKVPFVVACFQASAAPRPENSDSDEKDVLFGLDTQITIKVCFFFLQIC